MSVEPDLKAVGDRLVKAMKDRGIDNYGALSDRLRELDPKSLVREATISRWRSGKRLPSTKNLDVLSRVLGVSAAWLLWGEQGAPAAEDKLAQARALLLEHGWTVLEGKPAPEPPPPPAPPPAPPPRYSGVRAGKAAQHPSGSARKRTKR
jgi:transcriptional regulator with XRE-family HTH domain